MKDLPLILASYADLDGFLEHELETSDAPSRVRTRQALNDQASFFPCWGQLELEIDGRCRDAVGRRRTPVDWHVRRAWGPYNPDDRRFSGSSFEDRVRLVLDGQGGAGSPVARMLEHCGIRNQVAHGRLQATRVDVTAFVADCSVIQSALHRAL